MTISALTPLTNEFASKLIEKECSFEELFMTASLIREYLSASISDHVEASFDEDHYLNLIVSSYGIGEYDEAEKDLFEFLALFN
jgi:hypothetical protein